MSGHQRTISHDDVGDRRRRRASEFAVNVRASLRQAGKSSSLVRNDSQLAVDPLHSELRNIVALIYSLLGLLLRREVVRDRHERGWLDVVVARKADLNWKL